MNNLKYSLLFIITLIQFNVNVLSQKNINDQCLKLNEKWLQEALELTKNTVGYSAPVAARTFAYLSIGNYESAIGMEGNSNISLSNHLNNYHRKTWIQDPEKINFLAVANEVNYLLISYFYRNMALDNSKKVKELFESIKKEYYSDISNKISKKSSKYALEVVNEIINFSKMDGGDNGINTNFPKTFELVKCDSCWSKTYPGYFGALQPFWGTNGTLVLKDSIFTTSIEYIGFSTEKDSRIYLESQKLLELYTNIDKEIEITAEYWDDSPGYSGSPSGHFFSLALQLRRQYSLNFSQASQMYVMLGIAINDAVIKTWELKYKYNLLRPVTYIENYISKGFTPILTTPPFPEFPSGHSVQSGAGTEVLKKFFGNDIVFQDSTHAKRTDIDGSPRSFNSIDHLAEEVSISRYYGGIHFQFTLDESLKYGRSLGKSVVNEFDFFFP